MSRKWRAVAWGRLCSTFVKRLEPLLAKRARTARSEERSKELDAEQRGRMRTARQDWKARKRAHKAVAVLRRNPRTRRIRKVVSLLPLRHVRAAAGPRLIRVPVELPPGTRTYLTAEDRHRRHIRHVRAQRRRSERRMRLLEIRMQWARRQQENSAASEDLWQFAQEDESPRAPDRDLSAWPRLARRDREQLAQEVESFARISR
jgi:hypothetical protein